MGKKTTTRFMVTVTHRGPVKKFKELFHANYNVTGIQTKTEETKTEKTAPVPQVSDDLKIVRALLKKAAEAHGLKHANAFPVAPGNFKIHYSANGIVLTTPKTNFFAYLDGTDLSLSHETLKDKVICLADPDSLEEIITTIKKLCV